MHDAAVHARRARFHATAQTRGAKTEEAREAIVEVGARLHVATLDDGEQLRELLARLGINVFGQELLRAREGLGHGNLLRGA